MLQKPPPNIAIKLHFNISERLSFDFVKSKIDETLQNINKRQKSLLPWKRKMLKYNPVK